jgi:hypothetical protein
MQLANVVFAAMLAVALSFGSVHAQDRATQLAPDDFQLLVNKRLGQQQWAIVVNLDDSTASGNVFNLDGGAPAFVWCEIIEPLVSFQEDFVDATVELHCFVAGGCAALPCGADENRWQDVGMRTIPGSFFTP